MFTLLILASFAYGGDRYTDGAGIGPTVGTMGVPLEYPIIMPPLAQDDDGNNLVAPVGPDLRVGLHGLLMDGNGRLGARAHFASNFSTWGGLEATSEIDKALARYHGFYVFAGGGAGFGIEFFGAAADSVRPKATLEVRYIPLRGQVGVITGHGNLAIEANLFAT